MAHGETTITLSGIGKPFGLVTATQWLDALHNGTGVKALMVHLPPQGRLAILTIHDIPLGTHVGWDNDTGELTFEGMIADNAPLREYQPTFTLWSTEFDPVMRMLNRSTITHGDEVDLHLRFATRNVLEEVGL